MQSSPSVRLMWEGDASLLPVNEGARKACPLADDAFGSGIVVLSSRAFDRGIAPYRCTPAV